MEGGRWMKSGARGCVYMELPLCGREADHRVRPPMEGTERDSSSSRPKDIHDAFIYQLKIFTTCLSNPIECGWTARHHTSYFVFSNIILHAFYLIFNSYVSMDNVLK